MNAQNRIGELRARLLPRGSRLAEAPPDRHGLTAREWEELQRLESLASIEPSNAPPPINSQPVATARDGYGWRSLPSGSHLLDAENARPK